MLSYPVLLDIHTHSISSGHGSCDTITDMARAARGRGLALLGLSDHGPGTVGAGSSSYFRNLHLAERKRFNVSLLYGVELNILNEKGDVDLEDSLIGSLDYAFISLHHPVFQGGRINSAKAQGSLNRNASCPDENTFRNICTNAYINAMRHPGVRFLGHPDDGRFPVDFERLISACAEYHVYPEINNASLMPDAYRTDGYQNSMTILSLCKRLKLPVLLSSDSHGKDHVGDMKYIFPLLEECDFPPELIINRSPDFLRQILRGV